MYGSPNKNCKICLSFHIKNTRQKLDITNWCNFFAGGFCWSLGLLLFDDFPVIFSFCFLADFGHSFTSILTPESLLVFPLTPLFSRCTESAVFLLSLAAVELVSFELSSSKGLPYFQFASRCFSVWKCVKNSLQFHSSKLL